MDRSEPPASPLAFELPVFAPGSMGYQCTVSCGAGCCKYFSLPIETPRKDSDWDDVRWYLMHEDTHVYKYDDAWYILLQRRCKNLRPDNLCGIYETRPKICSDYDPTNCEYTGNVPFDEYFRDEHALVAWLDARRVARRTSAAKAAKTRARKARVAAKAAAGRKAARSAKAARAVEGRRRR